MSEWRLVIRSDDADEDDDEEDDDDNSDDSEKIIMTIVVIILTITLVMSLLTHFHSLFNSPRHKVTAITIDNGKRSKRLLTVIPGLERFLKISNEIKKSTTF